MHTGNSLCRTGIACRVELRRALAADFPAVPANLGWLSAALSNRAHHARRLGDLDRATKLWDEAHDCAYRSLEMAPDQLRVQTFLLRQLHTHARLWLQRADHERAMVYVEKRVALPFATADQLARIATVPAECATTLRKTGEPERARRYDDRALEILTRATDEGLARIAFLRARSFEALRDRPEFQRLVEQVSAHASQND